MRNGATESVKAKPPRLVFIVNSSLALGFLQGQLQFFQSCGFDVTVVCPGRKQDEWEVPRPEGVSIVEVAMERRIAPLRDLVSFFRLYRVLRAIQPAVTNAGTPKAGLLGGLAAWLNRVPCRVYTLHGLRFETAKGLRRRLLILAERLACCFAQRIICVSRSVREMAISSGVAKKKNIVMFGDGSCNGVDCSRFARTPERLERAVEMRRELGIPEDAKIVTFVGRMTRDKGIPELADAFLKLASDDPQVWLLLAGCFEDGDPVPAGTRRILEAHPRVILAGPVPDTVLYYAMSDVLVLPSHREGLPTVALEAQAVGIPVVGAAATGIVDLVADGVTGLLFPIGDASALAQTLARILGDKALAVRLGKAGQENVHRRFRQERVWEAHYREYIRLLESNESRLPFVPFDGGRKRATAGSDESAQGWVAPGND